MARRRKPRKYGSIQQTGITEIEKIEYGQTGMIRVKETAASGYGFPQWAYGRYRKINFRGILDGVDFEDLDPESDYPLNSRTMRTEYGIVAIEDFGNHYILTIKNPAGRREVVSNLRMYGHRVKVAEKGMVIVYREELEF